MWKSQNTRFIFSPAAAAESLPTCSKESRPCAPSKSWSTREPSSACASPACRYGMTCEPSAPTIQSAPECSQTYANAATRLSLPGAFRVRTFHAREKARAYAEREADYGRNMRVSFAKFDPVSYSWKIPHFLFQGDLATYSQTWPRWGMMVRGECFQLPPWVQDTGATAFGELSGAGIEDGNAPARFFGTSPCRPQPRSAKFRRSTPNLGEVVEEENRRLAKSAWPTPTAKGNGNRSEYGGKSGDGLDTAVKRAGAVSATGPTPKARDFDPTSRNQKPRDDLKCAVEMGRTKSHTYPTIGTKTMGGCSGSFAKLKELEEIGRQTPEERRAMSSHLTGGKDPERADCGMLNPDWVEWLMGWPIWWTDVNFRNADGGQCVMPWLDLADDPAEWPTPLMQRITTRKTHRVHRIETLGNGQVPLCAAVAFIYGRAILRVALRLAA